jgi:hypothetical protein
LLKPTRAGVMLLMLVVLFEATPTDFGWAQSWSILSSDPGGPTPEQIEKFSTVSTYLEFGMPAYFAIRKSNRSNDKSYAIWWRLAAMLIVAPLVMLPLGRFLSPTEPDRNAGVEAVRPERILLRCVMFSVLVAAVVARWEEQFGRLGRFESWPIRASIMAHWFTLGSVGVTAWVMAYRRLQERRQFGPGFPIELKHIPIASLAEID